MSDYLPDVYVRFRELYPGVVETLAGLGAATEVALGVADDGVFHFGGNGANSGDHKGREAITAAPINSSRPWPAAT